MYRATDFAEEKNKISTSLGSLKDPAMLKQVLEFAISPEVPSQESVLIIGSVARNKNGRELAWNFFKDNFSFFQEAYSSLFLGNSLVKSVTGVFASEEMASEVEAFFQANQFYGTEKAVSQSVESIRISANWLARELCNVKDYIKKVN